MYKTVFFLIVYFIFNISIFSQKIIIGSKINSELQFANLSNKPFLFKDIAPNNFYFIYVTDKFNNELLDSLLEIKKLGKSISPLCILSSFPKKVTYNSSLSRLDSLGIIILVDVNKEFKELLSSNNSSFYYIIDNKFNILQKPSSVSNAIYYFKNYYLISNNLIDKINY